MYYVISRQLSGLFPGALFQGNYRGVPVAIIPEPERVDFGKDVLVKPITRKVEDFLKDLRSLAPSFDWRRVSGVVEIAVHPIDRGWWVGKGGHRVKALESHMGCHVCLVDGQLVVNKDLNGVGRRVTGVPLLSGWELLRRAFYVYRNDGNDLSYGYVAPWEMSF